MNANSKQLTPAIKTHRQDGVAIIRDWLTDATNKLASAGVDSARLDSEVLLAHTLGKDRVFLHAHPEQIIYSKSLLLVNSYLKMRLNRMPIAYIIGSKEFYNRNFLVNSSVLIPRPESEAIIEILHEILLPTTYNLLPTLTLVDVGTGSGCLGITAKLEFPYLNVIMTDISKKALQVARLNTKALTAPVITLQSDLLDSLTQKVDIIIANLPYVDKSWVCSPETAFEPSLALFADDDGEALIKHLITQSSQRLSPNGYLILECDPRQHDSLIKFAKDHSFKVLVNINFVIAFQV